MGTYLLNITEVLAVHLLNMWSKTRLEQKKLLYLFNDFQSNGQV